jgi:hypothetical protein
MSFSSESNARIKGAGLFVLIRVFFIGLEFFSGHADFCLCCQPFPINLLIRYQLSLQHLSLSLQLLSLAGLARADTSGRHNHGVTCQSLRKARACANGNMQNEAKTSLPYAFFSGIA